MVLLVDDEPQIRRLLRQSLELQNYDVLTAASGEEALELSGQYTGRISLLITDIDMVEMDGIELHRRIQRERGAIPVLFISGRDHSSQQGPKEWLLLRKAFWRRYVLRRGQRGVGRNKAR